MPGMLEACLMRQPKLSRQVIMECLAEKTPWHLVEVRFAISRYVSALGCRASLMITCFLVLGHVQCAKSAMLCQSS